MELTNSEKDEVWVNFKNLWDRSLEVYRYSPPDIKPMYKEQLVAVREWRNSILRKLGIQEQLEAVE